MRRRAFLTGLAAGAGGLAGYSVIDRSATDPSSPDPWTEPTDSPTVSRRPSVARGRAPDVVTLHRGALLGGAAEPLGGRRHLPARC